MIVIDDLNDWTTLFDQDAPIRTPNLQRLADRGMLFTRAYCASPACNPSRVTALTGLRPTSTGVYGNRTDWRSALPNRLTIFEQFRQAGYAVRGCGKVFHHHLNGAFHDDRSFDDYEPMRKQLYPEEKLNQADNYGSHNTDWGAWPPSIEDSIDYGTATYAVEQLTNPPADQPLFLTCGVFKPHSPFFAPQAFHDHLSEVPLPLNPGDDWQDLPSGANLLMKRTQWFWHGMTKLDERLPGSYHNFVRGYAAAAEFADAQIGRVIDARHSTPRGRDTIVIIWSDHGFHLGEKNHIEKFALWEKANHVPFIVVAPGVTSAGSRCERPIDLSVLYPTLLDLCGITTDAACDGHSLVPLLRDPMLTFPQPALMTYRRGNHAVRSERWRYIHYADGTEELYDHNSDPHEWTNVASNPANASVLIEHRKWLPSVEKPPAPDLTLPKTATRKESSQ